MLHFHKCATNLVWSSWRKGAAALSWFYEAIQYEMHWGHAGPVILGEEPSAVTPLPGNTWQLNPHTTPATSLCQQWDRSAACTRHTYHSLLSSSHSPRWGFSISIWRFSSTLQLTTEGAQERKVRLTCTISQSRIYEPQKVQRQPGRQEKHWQEPPSWRQLGSQCRYV